MKEATFRAKPMIAGRIEGEAIVSRRAFTFAHGVEPSTGRVTDIHSDINGMNVKGKVLFYPFGKGSTTGSAWFLETVRLGNGPAAVATKSVDLSIVIGSVLARSIYSRSVPVLCELPDKLYASLASGNRVIVDGATGEIVTHQL
jgi:predicted aconitase with swiveling domain